MYHVVDLDIKGFFDNINHTKLIRQIWALGIRDKKLLCIIKEMLKASVILPNGDKTFPIKGTPQGGILSPLLANIVLNELDWWITSQWEEMPTKTDFTTRSNKQGTVIKSHAYRALRRSRLKEVHAVRYADDFKIFFLMPESLKQKAPSYLLLSACIRIVFNCSDLVRLCQTLLFFNH